MSNAWLRAGLVALSTSMILVAAGPGCAPGEAPSGVKRSVPHPGGPTVVFDLSRKPLPEIPLPNDIATWPDPTSRTGRRINASLVAPTNVERQAREKFSRLEGFGTFAPISIPFDMPLDTDDIAKHHAHDDFDFKDDVLYVVNLKTGVPVPLDVGGGNFPITLRQTDRYWPNDPAKGEANLLFETREEDLNGNGVLDPGEDTDFDGVLDHPNFPGRVRPQNGVDGLLTYFESETNTLIVRPMIPLDEMTEYAVVLTDRLHGVDAQHTAIQSPFDFIHHPEQKPAVQRLVDAMSRRPEYYGVAAADPLEHVQFVFTFTTQPTATDLFAMRDGIYGQGKLAWIAQEYPPQMQLFKAVGRVHSTDDDPADTFSCTDSSGVCGACKSQGPSSRFIARYTPAMKSTIKDVSDQVFNFNGPTGKRLVDAFDNIEYMAVGSMKVPWLLGDVKDVSPERSIDYDPATGKIPHSTDEVTFFIVVPKTTAEHKPPFPVAFYGHGYTGNGTEGLIFAGEMARHGLVTIGMNAPGHGIHLSSGEASLADALFGSGCLTPFSESFAKNRIRDLDGDGQITNESGGDFWTSYLFHTRDMVRQAVVEQMMLTRVLRSFDGTTRFDWDGDGKPDLAGDFDNDGVVDFGGPSVQYFAWGESLGGILSALQGGVDSYITATAPVAGGGALTDVGVRSFQGGVVEAVQMRIMSPLIVSVPAESRFDFKKNVDGKIVLGPDGKPIALPKEEQTRTLCNAGERSLRFFVVDLNQEREVEIGCASSAQLDTGFDVVVENRANGELRCAQVTQAKSDFDSAQFRIGIPASVGDRLSIAVWAPPPGKKQAVGAYGRTCNVLPGAVLKRSFDTFEGMGTENCPSDSSKRCIDFDAQTYEIGGALRAPAEGYGLRRQSPDFRKLMQLAQIALEPADPITFAPYYYLKTKPDPFGKPSPPTAVLSINTIGDMNVPVNTGIAAGRVHGAVPFLKPENVAARDYPDYVAPPELLAIFGGKTPNDVLLDNHVIEGIARLGRHPAGAGCAPNVNASNLDCKDATTYSDPSICTDALFDVENLSEGALPYKEQTLPKDGFLRLARLAQHASEGDTQTWGPRVSLPWKGGKPLGATLQPYIVPQGVHGFDPPNPCKLWDDGMYLVNTLAHFFHSGGTDLYYLSHPVTPTSTATSDHRCAAVTDPTKGCVWGD